MNVFDIPMCLSLPAVSLMLIFNESINFYLHVTAKMKCFLRNLIDLSIFYLHRQLLFRERHIGLPKAEVASESVRAINANIKVKAVVNKLCAETEVSVRGRNMQSAQFSQFCGLGKGRI